MTARWTIVTPAPKTATCGTCKSKRNRLSVYQGACYGCLHGLPVAAVVAPVKAAVKAAVKAPTAHPCPDCDSPIAGHYCPTPAIVAPAVVQSPVVCETDCARLPRHKGACRPTLHRKAA